MLYSQVYINKEWVQSDGQPQSLPWTATALDGDRNLIVVGNTEVGSGDHDVLIVKYDAEGTLLWQRTYGGNAGGNDYGVAVFAGQYGEIVVAAVVLDTIGAQNVAILQYEEDGDLAWVEKWNGPGELAEVPADLAVAYGDQIYVCGAIWSSDGLTTDYFTLNFDWNGGYQWEATYDYNGLIDAATQIELVNGEVIVVGGSASSINEWDYATVKYNAGTGEELDVIRVALPGVGLDNALAMFMDEMGNTYITGYKELNSQKDIQTIKIKSDFTLDWAQNFDLGYDDIGNAIAVDDSGYVYVAGTASDASGSYFLTIKYDSTGQEIWNEQYKPSGSESLGEATKLIAVEDGVIVTGHVSDGNSLNYVLVKYDGDGREIWRKEHDGGFGDDRALAVQAEDAGIFYVSGITETATGPKYTTVKYDVYVKDNPMVTDTSGFPLYRENEVIVKFRPALVDTTFVDDLEKQHTTVAALLGDSISSLLMAKLGEEPGESDKMKVVKLYRSYTRADSISLSRLDQEVRMPSLWSTFVIDIGNLDPIVFSDSLNNLKKYVCYAHPNIALRPYSNDPIFQSGLQGNLVPTSSYPDGHINIEPAWVIQTGRSDIKVGVIDNGINWEHQDFVVDGSTKIQNGWDYVDPFQFPVITSDNVDLYEAGWHGTSCAGIIGALRNNNEGVAGIAGGDVDTVGNTGTAIIPLIVYYGDGPGATFDIESAAPAIIDGSSDIIGTPNGFGCHVLNASWGQPFDPWVPTPVALMEAIQSAYLNNCVYVSASGNYGIGDVIYNNWPTTFTGPGERLNDHAILTVGASGNDGYWMNPTNAPNMETFSNGGDELDVIAPGSQSLIAVPADAGPFGVCANALWEYDDYSCFGATSAAAPHVSGTAALMIAQHSSVNGAPNDLSPDDVEQILE